LAETAAFNQALNGFTGVGYDNPQVNSVAPYIHATWHATSNFDLTGGLRYSYTAKEGIFEQWQQGGTLPATSSPYYAPSVALQNAQRPIESFYATTHQGIVSGLITASYHFTPDVLGYITYSRGGRAGGPNLTQLPVAALNGGSIPLTVKPETLDNYEIGVKTSWWDQRITANTSLFVMADHNYITTISQLVNGTTTSYLANAALAMSRGVEFDLRAEPIDDLKLYTSVVYDDAYYGSYNNGACPFEVGPTATGQCNLTGQPLSLVPRWTVSVGGNYTHSLGSLPAFSGLPQQSILGYAGADFTYQTKYFSSSDDSAYEVINAYGLLNLHAGIKADDGHWDLSAWVHNALDKHYFTSLTLSATGGEIQAQVGDPLMAGMTLRVKL
jgi:iron complex outermembrane receptor protein